MGYIVLPTRTSNDINSAADINQLMENCDWLKDNRYPVGSYYIQFPDANSNDSEVAFPTSQSPANLFGGTWTRVWDNEGVFFRTEGDPYGEGQNHMRTNGKQLDTTQSHRHVSGTMRIWDAITGLYGDIPNAVVNIRYPVARYTDSLTSADLDYTSGLVQETGGSPRTGYETRPLNRIIRVWKRTA